MAQINVGSTKIKKIYVGGTQIKKAYVGSTQVYSADVVLTNVIGDTTYARDTRQIDAGYNYGWFTHSSRTVTAGHRYYARCDAYGAGSFTAGPNSIAAIDNANIAQNNTAHAIITMDDGTAYLKHYIEGSCTAGTYTVIVATYYMLVDITELEQALNRTFTADQFWSYIGSQVFYGNKTIVL